MASCNLTRPGSSSQPLVAAIDTPSMKSNVTLSRTAVKTLVYAIDV
jgi:hypothetical protein